MVQITDHLSNVFASLEPRIFVLDVDGVEHELEEANEIMQDAGMSWYTTPVNFCATWTMPHGQPYTVNLATAAAYNGVHVVERAFAAGQGERGFQGWLPGEMRRSH